jgi:hypothetical protein
MNCSGSNQQRNWTPSGEAANTNGSPTETRQVAAMSLGARVDLVHARQENIIRQVEQLQNTVNERVQKIEQLLTALLAAIVINNNGANGNPMPMMMMNGTH